jgi:hypothetical protein
MIHKLAAIKLVRELEMEVGSLSLGYPTQNKDPKEEELKTEITKISCQHGSFGYVN